MLIVLRFSYLRRVETLEKEGSLLFQPGNNVNSPYFWFVVSPKYGSLSFVLCNFNSTHTIIGCAFIAVFTVVGCSGSTGMYRCTNATNSGWYDAVVAAYLPSSFSASKTRRRLCSWYCYYADYQAHIAIRMFVIQKCLRDHFSNSMLSMDLWRPCDKIVYSPRYVKHCKNNVPFPGYLSFRVHFELQGNPAR